MRRLLPYFALTVAILSLWCAIPARAKESIYAAANASTVFSVIQYFSAGFTVTGGTVDMSAATVTLPTAGVSQPQTKCVNVDPTNTTVTDWLGFKFKRAATITHVDCLVDAATSVVMTPQSCDVNGANCTDIEAAITCAATNTAESGAIDTPAITAGQWLRVTRGTKTGSPTQAILCVTYTEP